MIEAKSRRIRCLDHILNLALQAFLLAKSKEALTAAFEATDNAEGTDAYLVFATALGVPLATDATQTASDEAVLERIKRRRKVKDFEGWGATPALKKLHELAVWLRTSTRHADLWREAIGITLGINNNTRWTSWYKVIDRAICNKEKIMLFIVKHGHALGDNILIFNNWELLGQTHVILQFIYQSMLVVKGDTASLQQSLMTMDALLSFFEDKKVCPYINPITN